MTTESFNVQIPNCCLRISFLISCLQQAKNLNLQPMYVNELQSLILQMMSLDHDQLVIKYDAEIDSILLLRSESFEIYKNELVNRFTPIPKIESVE